MRMLCATLFSLSAALTTALATYAQGIAASMPTSDEQAQCAKWVRETVPANLHINGSDFCAGVKRDGSPDSWYSIQNCGERPGSDTASAKMYCASSGAVGPDWTIAAGYTGSGPDGGELISEMHEGSTPPVATLYSRTPLLVGDKAIPAGFSRLTFSHTDHGWQMAIVPEKEKIVRSVQLLSDSRQLSAAGRKNLAIGVHYASPRCADFPNVRELVFTYSGTDLYVCMRPDHIAPMLDESAGTQ